MPNIDVSDDLGSWMGLCPELGAGLVALSDAVYGRSRLPLRVHEIARMRIAPGPVDTISIMVTLLHTSADATDGRTIQAD